MTTAERLLARIVAALGVGAVALLLYALTVPNYRAIGWAATSVVIALLTYAVLRDEHVDG